MFSCSKIEHSSSPETRQNSLLRDVSCNVVYSNNRDNVATAAYDFKKIEKGKANVGQFSKIFLNNNVSKATLLDSGNKKIKEIDNDGSGIAFDFKNVKTGVYFIEYVVGNKTVKIELLHFSSKLPITASPATNEGLTIKPEGTAHPKDSLKRRIDISEVYARNIMVRGVTKEKVNYTIKEDPTNKEKYFKINTKDFFDKCKKMDKKEAHLHVKFEEFVTWKGVEYSCKEVDTILINENSYDTF